MMHQSDPFAPLPATAMPNGSKPAGRSPEIILPAPAEPPVPGDLRHNGYGVAVQCWIYRDAAQAPLFLVARFEASGKRKIVLPLTFCRDAKGEGWRYVAPSEPRPLYGLDRLAAAPSATVLIAEGEKAADAATAILPGFVAVTSQGGAQAAGKADWTPLRGRDVVIWPDQDEPGRSYAQAAHDLILKAGARSVRIVEVPKEWPEGWDLADLPPPGVTIETLRKMAEVKPDPERLVFIEPHKLQGKPVPEREWIVEDWLPVGAATLLFGDGGTGKTLLAQQLMTSCATGKPWIRLAVARCRSLAIFCEDDAAELHRRQDRINATYGVEFDDLDELTWASGAGQDNCLMRFLADGRPQRMERLTEIKAAAIAHQARLVVLDTAADIFGGNENDRAQVRNFMGAANALAMEIGGAVLINAHPSRSGLSKDGDLDGGSTAWSNSARSRWSLARPKAEGDEQADTNERLLTRRKANYASIGDTIKLRWQNGVLVPIGAPTGLAAMAERADADAVFLRLLARLNAENRPLSPSRNAGNSAPKAFAQCPDRQGFRRRDFEAAMERLFAANKITTEEYGRPNGRGQPRRIVAIEAPANG
jgi:RecA-family ATPase